MRLHLLRNATMRLHYGGLTWLTDPDLAPRHSRDSFTGRSPNPMTGLPLPPEQAVAGVDAVLLTHLHADHWDGVQGVLPAGVPILCQPGDAAEVRGAGFTDVTEVGTELTWRGVTVRRTDGHHGLGAVEALMGRVSGFVLRAPGEPTLYWAGDTVLCDEVRQVVAQVGPDLIVLHAGGAVWGEARAPIIMDAAQALEVARLAPGATLVAVHLEALDHCLTGRAELRAAAQAAGLAGRLRVPEDGETTEVRA